jgi:DNA-binding NarL/FixJ family response regulator
VGREIKVFVVDDHPIVRQGLIQVISREEDMSVCGEAGDGPGALQGVAEGGPDVAVVDLHLAQGDGIDLIKQMHKLHPRLPVLVLTMHEESFYVERAMRAGAQGFLTKQDAGEKVLAAIRKLAAGEMYVCDRVSPKLLKRLLAGGEAGDDSPVARFSDREMQVFRLIGEGLGTKEIAGRLNLSVKTIETYRANIKEKLGLRDARELVQYAIRWVIGQGRS